MTTIIGKHYNKEVLDTTIRTLENAKKIIPLFGMRSINIRKETQVTSLLKCLEITEEALQEIIRLSMKIQSVDQAYRIEELRLVYIKVFNELSNLICINNRLS
jgi:hypothetical protein